MKRREATRTVRMKDILRVAMSADIVRAASQAAIVVGTALNMINQGSGWLSGGEISVGALLLNYVIPYSVATYSASRTRLMDGR